MNKKRAIAHAIGTLLLPIKIGIKIDWVKSISILESIQM
jgi:hypothetical protein